MTSDPVPGDIRDLIRRHIDPVIQIEPLLFLRACPGENWNVASIAERLYAPEPEIGRALAGLCEQGFLARDNDDYRYECSGEHQHIADRLAGACSLHLAPLTNFIHAQSRGCRTFSAP